MLHSLGLGFNPLAGAHVKPSPQQPHKGLRKAAGACVGMRSTSWRVHRSIAAQGLQCSSSSSGLLRVGVGSSLWCTDQPPHRVCSVVAEAAAAGGCSGRGVGHLSGAQVVPG